MTKPINIEVEARFIKEQSKPRESKFVYAYTITIENQSEEPARLVSRCWSITDANEQIQKVEGLGVVGEQPRLEPGESYTYTSGVVMQTETGIMQGNYTMVKDDGDKFEAQIPAFSLVQAKHLH